MIDHPDEFGGISDLDAAPTLDEAEARDITDKIIGHLEDIWELVVRAYMGRAWIALGHQSWHDYCAAEFGHRLRLPRDERKKVVRFLSDAGLTIRPIASAMGISPQTVQADLAAGVSNQHTSEPTDGSDSSDGITTDAEPNEPNPPNPGNGDGVTNGSFPPHPGGCINENGKSGKSTGTDGKQYPKKGRRRLTSRMNDSFIFRFDAHMSQIRDAARAIERMCRTNNWAAPHSDLRVTLKLLNRVQEIIERVLAMPEQFTFDSPFITDEEIDARINERLPLNDTDQS